MIKNNLLERVENQNCRLSEVGVAECVAEQIKHLSFQLFRRWKLTGWHGADWIDLLMVDDPLVVRKFGNERVEKVPGYLNFEFSRDL